MRKVYERANVFCELQSMLLYALHHRVAGTVDKCEL